MIYKMFKHFPGLDALRKSQTLVADAMHPVVDDIRTAHLFRVHAKACTVVLHVVTSLLFVFRSPPERSSFIVDEHRIRAQSEIEIVHCRHALKDIYLPGLGEIIKDIVSFLIQSSLRVLGYRFLVFSKSQQLVIFSDSETIHRCFEEDIPGFVGVSLGFNRE